MLMSKEETQERLQESPLRTPSSVKIEYGLPSFRPEEKEVKYLGQKQGKPIMQKKASAPKRLDDNW